MSLKTTPETTKTVPMTGEAAAGQGPTPKNEFKKPLLKQRQYFMSPTDAMVSPCTQKLQTSRLLQRKPLNHKSYKFGFKPSSLTNKENKTSDTAAQKPTQDRVAKGTTPTSAD